MTTFLDQERFDKEFERYLPMHVAGDVKFTFGEFYARQGTTKADEREELKIQRAIDADLDRIMGWKVK